MEPHHDGEAFGITEQTAILNWFRQYDPKSSIKKDMVIEYLKINKITIKNIRSIDETYFYHPFSSLCRMSIIGFPLTKEATSFINKSIETLRQIKTPKKKEKRVINPAALFKIKADIVTAELDIQFDNYLLKGEDSFDWEIFIAELEPKYLSELTKTADEYIKEFTELLTDKELRDGYNIKPKRVKEIIKFFENKKEIFLDNKTAKVKVKKKKKEKIQVKSITKKNKPVTMKYNSSSEWASYKPERLIDKKEAVLYNTKTKKLIYLCSETGFKIDNAIRNINTELSFHQKLRDTKIKEFYGMHKRVRNQSFKDFQGGLTTKPTYNFNPILYGNDELVIISILS